MNLAQGAIVSAFSITHLDASKHSINSSRADEEDHNYLTQDWRGCEAFPHKRRNYV